LSNKKSLFRKELRMKKFVIAIILIGIFSGVGLGVFFNTKTENNETKKIEVFASILPQKYFIEKIAGDRVNVNILVSPGKSPATYTPTPKQVIALSSSKVFFTIGVPFENAFIDKVKSNLENIMIVDTSEGINKRYLENHLHEEGEIENDHDKHKLRTEDPHIWMSPVLVKNQAKRIYEALVKIDPNGKADYKNGYEILIAELDQLNEYLHEKLKDLKGSTLFVFHPAFGYFADEYGLHQEAVEIGGKEPLPAILEKIIEKAKEENVRVIFVQAEFSKKSANAIASAIDGAVVELNPLNPDYINNLKKIGELVEGALEN
jgi:zinc transport system substrate-binding protein